MTRTRLLPALLPCRSGETFLPFACPEFLASARRMTTWLSVITIEQQREKSSESATISLAGLGVLFCFIVGPFYGASEAAENGALRVITTSPMARAVP